MYLRVPYVSLNESLLIPARSHRCAARLLLWDCKSARLDTRFDSTESVGIKISSIYTRISSLSMSGCRIYTILFWNSAGASEYPKGTICAQYGEILRWIISRASRSSTISRICLRSWNANFLRAYNRHTWNHP